MDTKDNKNEDVKQELESMFSLGNDDFSDVEEIEEFNEDDFFDFEALENELRAEVDNQLSELKILEENREKIGNPESLGEIIKDVVWEQFINQIGVTAGEEFIRKNRGLKLDLRDDAHIQTTENFKEGSIAAHNTEINYQQRYDDWQSNFVRDEEGYIVMRYDRIDDEDKAVLRKDARKPFDEGRPKGSSSASVDMDHTVSAGEIIRDPQTNAHLSKEEQLSFANSDANLNPLDSSANKSKGDHRTKNWLDSERDGQKPAERFNIDEEQLREKDKEAREEFAKEKKEGEKRSVEAGKRSQKTEAFRVGGEALKAFFMVLLADLIRKIIRELVAWLKSTERNIKTFFNSIKTAVNKFIENIKRELLSATDIAVTAIVTAIIGPIVRVIKKVWILLKQGYHTIKKAIQYLKNPENRAKSFEILMFEVGKIVITGLSAAGALVLGEVIEKALMPIPFFGFVIPMLGSIASIMGIFLGALISGIVGALALRMIDNAAAKHQLAKIRQQEDLIYVKAAQTEAAFALARAGNTGTHVVRTEEIFFESAIDMSKKRERTKKCQDETQSTMDEIENDVKQTTEKIDELKSDNEEFEL